MKDPKKIQQQIHNLLQKSNFVLTPDEWQQIVIQDFGLGNFHKEGVVFVDILSSQRLRITLLILLPQQTLPQHLHPAYGTENGKEETLRVLYGQTKIYVEGLENSTNIHIPERKNYYYTSRHEICLNVGQQFTIKPGIPHWFQSGLEGSVNLTFQNRVDETKNIFNDPESTSCQLLNRV